MAAIAGKVAITPKGEWNVATQYEKLDFVLYGDDSYVARKESVGVEPGTDDETWQLSLRGASAQQIEDIINGTTPVGNALSLGGKTAEEWAEEIASSGGGDADTLGGETAEEWQAKIDTVYSDSNINVYVSPSGNDETGDGTQENPWATIQKAVDECPPSFAVRKYYCVWIEDGTYTGDVTIVDRKMRIYAVNRPSGNVTIKGNLTIERSTIDLRVPLTIDVSTEIKYGLTVTYGSNVWVEQPLTINSNKNANYLTCIYMVGSLMQINNDVKLNNTIKGMAIHLGSILWVVGGTITNCTNGLEVKGSIVTHQLPFSYNSVSAQTITTDGGRIYTGAQTSVGKY